MKAYPFLHKHPTSGETTVSEGMELRDWFAGLAMQAYLINPSSLPAYYENVFDAAYETADDLMLARHKSKENPNE